MRIQFLQEPELQFGSGRHIDIRFGLMNYGPLDFDSLLAPKRIKLGMVGTPESVEGVVKWFEKCRAGIPAKMSKRPNLFPRFPGYGESLPLCAELLMDSKLQRTIPESRFQAICQKPKTDNTLQELAQLFLDELKDLAENTTIDVFVCAFPFVLVKYLDQDDDEVVPRYEDDEENPNVDADVVLSKVIFHDLLKALSMKLRKPIQVVRPATYDERKRLLKKKPTGEKRQLQDEATRAWNIYTALYYKAGGTPWRLVHQPSQLATCYIGVSFYKSLDESRLLTSMAQVFNERGEGVVLRGGTAIKSKDDKQIHLSADDSFDLLKNALETYRREHKNFPARVVVHKSSSHNSNEIEGFTRALQGFSIEPEQADFVSLTRSYTRLLRAGRYPPLRGTLLDTDGELFILYTKGSVDFFSAYPGMYVPVPLGFRCDKTTETPTFIANEILALTKMNWNNTQFDGGQPISLRAAQQVGSILKYLDQDFEPNYRFYM